jgi:hypothetical protein
MSTKVIDDEFGALDASIAVATDALASAWKDGDTSIRLGLNRLIGMSVSRFFDARMTGPTDLDSLTLLKFWASVAETCRNPAIGYLPSADWLTPSALRSLQREAAEVAPSASTLDLPSYNKKTNSAIDLLLRNEEFFSWAEAVLGKRLSRQQVEFSYIHYSSDNQHCRVHLDRPDTNEYNCLICLHHHKPEPVAEYSELRLFAGGNWSQYRLDHGGAIVFHSACTLHGRTALAKGERLSLLSIGLVETHV